MKILLLYRSGRAGAGDYVATMMPMGLGYIHAALRDGLIATDQRQAA